MYHETSLDFEFLCTDTSIFRVVVEECQDLVFLQPADDNNQGTMIIDITGVLAINWVDIDVTQCLYIINYVQL